VQGVKAVLYVAGRAQDTEIRRQCICEHGGRRLNARSAAVFNNEHGKHAARSAAAAVCEHGRQKARLGLRGSS
jgi:hypothetical protein